MARFRPWCFTAALCLLAGMIFFGCGGSEQAPPPATKKVVKGKVPVAREATPARTQTSVKDEAVKPDSSAPALAEPVKQAPVSVPVQAAGSVAPAMDVASTGESEAMKPPDAGSASPQVVEPSSESDATGSTPMEDGLVAAAKLKRLLSLETAFSYEPEGKIDPFKPVFGTDEPELLSDGAGQKTAEREKRIPQSPIEMVDLSQLKLTAVILAPGGNLAMVEDATGKGYIVKKGTYIGNREGRVTEILPDRLIVTEQGQDDLGKPITDAREIQLPKPPGEM